VTRHVDGGHRGSSKVSWSGASLQGLRGGQLQRECVCTGEVRPSVSRKKLRLDRGDD